MNPVTQIHANKSCRHCLMYQPSVLCLHRWFNGSYLCFCVTGRDCICLLAELNPVHISFLQSNVSAKDNRLLWDPQVTLVCSRRLSCVQISAPRTATTLRLQHPTLALSSFVPNQPLRFRSQLSKILAEPLARPHSCWAAYCLKSVCLAGGEISTAAMHTCVHEIRLVEHGAVLMGVM